MFYLPKPIAKRMRRDFSPDEFDQLKDVFRSFDLAHTGHIDEHAARVALDSLGEVLVLVTDVQHAERAVVHQELAEALPVGCPVCVPGEQV